MPRTKKTKNPQEFKLDFTGKMSLVVDLEGYGPMHLRANNKDVVLAVLKAFLDMGGHITDVDSYGKREEKTLKKLMDDIK